MFTINDILYEDNHLIVVNKRCGDLVQPDRDTNDALETEIKAMIKVRDHKAGDVFLGVVHRIDRPVSGAVLFAKTSKALVRLNEMIKAYAKANKILYVDHYSIFVDEQGGLPTKYAADGVHPNLKAYKLMEQILLRYL